MFCPKCSQEQVSDEMRFCSRCGFRLTGVSELLSSDGALPVRYGKQTEIIPGLRRKKNLPGAKIMFFSICLLPVAVGIGIAVNGPAPLLISIIPFFTGLVYMLYALVFRNQNAESRRETVPEISQIPPPPPAYVAPPAQMKTGELTPMPPPSVTDQTTKLLGREGRERV